MQNEQNFITTAATSRQGYLTTINPGMIAFLSTDPNITFCRSMRDGRPSWEVGILEAEDHSEGEEPPVYRVFLHYFDGKLERLSYMDPAELQEELLAILNCIDAVHLSCVDLRHSDSTVLVNRDRVVSLSISDAEESRRLYFVFETGFSRFFEGCERVDTEEDFASFTEGARSSYHPEEPEMVGPRLPQGATVASLEAHTAPVESPETVEA